MTTTDRRAELSAKLKRLSEGPQWFTWRGRRLRLGAVPDGARWPALAVIVHRGRFGLADVVDKGGLRALDVEWLDGGRTTAQVYLRRHQVRALISESPFEDAVPVVRIADPQGLRPLVFTERVVANAVGKPVLDGIDGPEIGHIVHAESDGDHVRVTAEVSRGSRPTHLKPVSLSNGLMLMLAMATLGVDDKGEPR